MHAEHDLERLEELVLGTLSAADAAAVEAHLAECTECRAELALLRAERRAFDHYADDAELPPFEGVLARMPEHQVARAVPTTIARPPRRLPTALVMIAAAAAIPLAAGVLLGVLGHREPAPAITAVASAAAATPAPTVPRRHHDTLSCEPDAADDDEPSCGSCSGDDDAGER